MVKYLLCIGIAIGLVILFRFLLILIGDWIGRHTSLSLIILAVIGFSVGFSGCTPISGRQHREWVKESCISNHGDDVESYESSISYVVVCRWDKPESPSTNFQ